MRESNVVAFPAQPIKPGVYLRGQVDYGSIEAVNQSSLKTILKSPLHYMHALEHPKPSTDAMQRGTVTHTAVLEPSRIAAEYAVWEDTRTDDKTGEVVKQVRRGKIWDQFQVAHAGKTIVRESDMEAAFLMRDAVAASPLARHHLRAGKGSNEVTIVWIEPTTKALCKSRLDRAAVIGSAHYVTDLKGCSDMDPGAFARNCANLGYHFQAAFYSDAYEVTFGVRPVYSIVCVEMRAPHDIVVYQLSDADLEKGRRLYREALTLRAECIAAKSWPGIGNGMVQPLNLPDWAAGNDNDDLNLVIGGEMVGV